MKKNIIYLTLLISTLLFTACTSNTRQAKIDDSSVITADEARQFALNHAGITENQATFVRSEPDMDDGTLKYDVEFYTNDGLEYDYEIDSHTGKVLGFDIDARG